jgi:hypothetical protein
VYGRHFQDPLKGHILLLKKKKKNHDAIFVLHTNVEFTSLGQTNLFLSDACVLLCIHAQ